MGGPSLDRATERLLRRLGDGPFVFNLGHGVLPETPPEHVSRVADLVREFRRRMTASDDTKTAIVLFNLGGPDALPSVEPFLFNLFNDPAIIGLPGRRGGCSRG